MKIYYRDLMKNEIYNYFTYRFGQPRYLVGASLATIFPRSKKPILDLACGIAHFGFFLASRNVDQLVVGLDRNFSQLYIGKKFVAPAAEYVCAEADEPLPFPNDSFSGVLCSDAFHYFIYKWACVRELRRIICREGAIIFTRVGNLHLPPHEGYEVTAQNYKELFSGMPNIIVGEDMILERYVRKHGPDLSKDLDQDEVNKFKWLSIIASHRKDLFQVHGEFLDWPHALGRLRINPLYHNCGRDETGNSVFKFKFPSQWYEFEDRGWLEYAPKRAEVPPRIIQNVASGLRTPEMEDLIAKCVILGMPEYYL
jgi:ubiquinone/menaquinone biosynthesis C-methylase UbiE